MCVHPERGAIDRALVTGEPIPRLAAVYRASEDALTRHKRAHLPRLLKTAQEATEAQHGASLVQQQQAQAVEEARQALDVVEQLRAVNQASLTVLKQARERGNGELALKAIDRVVRQIELQAKLLGDLDERPVVNVLVSPQWVTVRTALLVALAPYPEARTAAAAALTRLEAG